MGEWHSAQRDSTSGRIVSSYEGQTWEKSVGRVTPQPANRAAQTNAPRGGVLEMADLAHCIAADLLLVVAHRPAWRVGVACDAADLVAAHAVRSGALIVASRAADDVPTGCGAVHHPVA